MANIGLQSDFKSLLTQEGLSLDAFDADFLFELFKVRYVLDQKRAPDVVPKSDATLRQQAAAVANSGGFWNFRIQSLVSSVLQAAQPRLDRLNAAHQIDFILPDAEELFFGEFPTNSFNATVRQTKHGYLILLNSGLPQLLSEVCLLLSEARPSPLPAEIRSRRIEHSSLIAFAVVRKYWRESNFIAVKSSGGRGDETALDLRLNDWLLETTLAFVVAHEISHIVLGHCGDGRKHRLMGVASYMRSSMPIEWKEELAADSMSAMIVESWFAHKLQHSTALEPDLLGLFVSHALFSSLFFFSCERLIGTLLQRDDERAEDLSHPPPALRQRCLVLQNARQSDTHRSLLLETRHYRVFLKDVERQVETWFRNGTHDANENVIDLKSSDAMQYLEKLAREAGWNGETD